jgi:hypothetical protein
MSGWIVVAVYVLIAVGIWARLTGRWKEEPSPPYRPISMGPAAEDLFTLIGIAVMIWLLHTFIF